MWWEGKSGRDARLKLRRGPSSFGPRGPSFCRSTVKPGFIMQLNGSKIDKCTRSTLRNVRESPIGDELTNGQRCPPSWKGSSLPTSRRGALQRQAEASSRARKLPTAFCDRREVSEVAPRMVSTETHTASATGTNSSVAKSTSEVLALPKTPARAIEVSESAA